MGIFDGQIVFLVTDVLLYIMLAIVALYCLYARKQVHLKEQWRQLANSSAAMCSGAILLVYLVIGVADSMHFRPLLKQLKVKQVELSEPIYSAEIISVLDVALTGLRNSGETSYSAPLATHAFSKQSKPSVDGAVTRAYPRLKFGGAHLENVDHKGGDLFKRVLVGVLIGALFCLPFWLVRLLRRRKKKLKSKLKTSLKTNLNTEEPLEITATKWHVFWITLVCVIIVASIIAKVSAGYHVLGTDKIGTDVLYQSLKSIRTGLLIGTLTTLIMLPFGIAMGVIAGYFRGWVDDVIQYLYTTLNSIPSVLLIAAAVLMLQVYLDNHSSEYNSLVERADMRLFFLCLILGITSWTGLCRYIRAETLKLREMSYVAAAKVQGVGHFQILSRHILPNVMHIVLITIALDFSGLVLAEAVLAYVQIGVDPSTESWGNMINGARMEMARDPIIWWSLASAFVFMFVLVLAANIFSDAVRDVLDPRTNHSD